MSKEMTDKAVLKTMRKCSKLIERLLTSEYRIRNITTNQADNLAWVNNFFKYKINEIIGVPNNLEDSAPLVNALADFINTKTYDQWISEELFKLVNNTNKVLMEHREIWHNA